MSDKRKDELLPCPFCGSEANLKHDTLFGSDSEVMFWRIECSNEDCSVGNPDALHSEKEGLIAEWNTRSENTEDMEALTVAYMTGFEKGKEEIREIERLASAIIDARDFLVTGQGDEAYHRLYEAANPEFDSLAPWKELEAKAAKALTAPKDVCPEEG